MLPNAIVWLLLTAAAAADSAGRYNSDLLPTNTDDLVMLPPGGTSAIDVAIIIDGTELTAASAPNYVSLPTAQEAVPSQAVPVSEAPPSILSPPQAPLGSPTAPNPTPKSIPISDAAVTKPTEAQPTGPAPAPAPKSYSTTKPKEKSDVGEKTYVGEKASGPAQPAREPAAPAPSVSGGTNPADTSLNSETYTASKSAVDTAVNPGAPSTDYNTLTAAAPNTPTAFPQSDVGFQRVGEYDSSKQSPFMVADVYPKPSPSNYTVGPPPLTYPPNSQFISGTYLAPKDGAKPSSAAKVSASIGMVVLVAALMFV